MSFTVVGEISLPDGTVRKFYISAYNAEMLADNTRDAIKELTASASPTSAA